mgnify:CR=1 FL=1
MFHKCTITTWQSSWEGSIFASTLVSICSVLEKYVPEHRVKSWLQFQSLLSVPLPTVLLSVIWLFIFQNWIEKTLSFKIKWTKLIQQWTIWVYHPSFLERSQSTSLQLIRPQNFRMNSMTLWKREFPKLMQSSVRSKFSKLLFRKIISQAASYALTWILITKW